MFYKKEGIPEEGEIVICTIKKILPNSIFVNLDEYQNKEFCEKSSGMAGIIKKAGFQWKGKITWYQAGAKLRPYGVPYSYVPNITDQKILVFKNSTKIGGRRLNGQDGVNMEQTDA